MGGEYALPVLPAGKIILSGNFSAPGSNLT